MERELEKIFYPNSVALIGASEEADYYIKPISTSKLKDRFFLVNPRHSEVLGLGCYPSILDIPGSIDYAIIAVPAKLVPQIMRECGEKGVKVAQIYSSGFSETGGSEGRKLEEIVMKVARSYGIRVIGPNCMGIYCPGSGLSFSHDLPSDEGYVAFISQSGGQAINFVLSGLTRGLSFSKVVSYGNAVDVDFLELVEYLGEDPKTRIISAYVEGLRRTNGLLGTLRRVSNKKPVIILKGGKTEEGVRAVSSHTGVLAGSHNVWSGFLKQVGAVQVEDFGEMTDVIVGFLHAPTPKGNGVSIVTTSGGSAVVHTDLCVKAGLNVPKFEEETQKRLKSFIPVAGTSVKNPLDAWPAFQYGMLSDALKVAASDRNIHSLILEIQPEEFKSYTSAAVEQVEKFIDVCGENCKEIMEEHEKPVMVTVTESYYYEVELELRSKFQKMGLPVYSSIYNAAKALSKMYQFRKIHKLDKLIHNVAQ